MTLDRIFLACALMSLLGIANAAEADPQSSVRVIVYAKPFQPGDSSQMYQVKLLSAALHKVGIAHLLVPSQTPMLQERALRTIADNQGVDVFWSLTTVEREQQLRPVRFPIDKGLYGWRLLLVSDRPNTPPQKVQRLVDLNHWVFTQGHDWPDTFILRHNNLNVVASNNFQSMVEMVNLHRVHAFPRSAIEVWREQRELHLPLVVEQNLVLHYPIALYYFFSKEQEQLAQQVEQGLELLRQSGEFDALFNAEFGDAIEQSAFHQRRIIELLNPMLPAATPLDRAELWFHPAPNPQGLFPNE